MALAATLAVPISIATSQTPTPSSQTQASEEAESAVTLSPFVVDTSKDVGYKATNSISATRTNEAIASVPMNIQVVTSELLDDLAVTSPTQALRFFGSVGSVDAGATSRFGLGVDLDASEQMFGGVRLRGLSVNEGLRNGIRAYSQLPSEFIDRVELVRGPAAVLYGLSEPTGIYNAITKSPVLGRDFGEIKASIGNYSNHGGSLDVNRTLGDDLAFRFLASAHHFDSEFVDNEGYTYYVMPQVVWRPLPETTLKVEYTYGYSKRALPDQRYVYPQNWTLPNHPTVVPGMIIPIYEDARYDIDPRFSFAGPDAFREIYDRNLVVTLTQQIGEHFSINLQGSKYNRPLEVDNANVALIPGAINPNVAAGNSTFWSDQQTTPQDAFVLRRWQDDLNTQKVDAFKNPFDPRFGEGTEYGVKFDVLNNRVSGTVSFWDIDQTNRVIFDVNAPNPNVASGLGANVARGLNTSRGWEADVFFSWTNGLQSMLSYAHTKVTTSGDVNPLVIGAREFGSYAHGFGAVTSYRFSEGSLKGFTVGLGVNYTSETIATGREAFNGNRQRTTPSAWDGNAFIGYRTRLFERDWRFQLNVNNLFERDFFVGWDPSRPNDLGVPDQPFEYPTERKFTFTTAVSF